MAFAAVLTALGYYIILRRFCQGLLKIFLQGAATGGKFSLFAACQPRLWRTSLPLPPAGDSGGRSSRRPKPPRLSRVPLTPAEPARQGKPLRQRVIRPLLRCRPTGGGRGPLPVRHLFDLPRGRGPSQTPPSRATDSSISPGPPSPWLPALPIEWLFYRFCGEPQVQPRGCKGRSPLHEITLVSPFPAGEERSTSADGGIGGRKAS